MKRKKLVKVEFNGDIVYNSICIQLLKRRKKVWNKNKSCKMLY